MTEPIVDVAIVGGGVSGVYSGWRMLTTNLNHSDVLSRLAEQRPDGKLNVHLYELSHRIGGRLMSITPPEMPGFKAEFGGMRFLTTQRVVRSLVDKLDLQIRPFPVSGEDNIYYLRGRHLRQREFADPDKVPYHLSWQERGKGPGQLIANAIDTILPGAARLSPVEWQEVKRDFKFNGDYLYNQGFWNVLHQVMSGEAYKLLLDSGGYMTTLSNWNAAEAMEWYLIDFGPDAEYVQVVNGYERLPQRLLAEFESAGGAVHYHHRLTHFEKLEGDENGPLLRLHFAGQPPVQARHVILAMPRRSLDLLDETHTAFLSEAAVRDAIASVTPQPMFKMFMCYRYPWWRDAGVHTGRAITDLPLRQTYYFDSEPDPGHYEPEMMDSLLMASYDDGQFVGFWTGMVSHLSDIPGYQPGDNLEAGSEMQWSQLQAPPIMVMHAQRQLKLVHDLEFIPEPYAAAYINWGCDPFGGAWNAWNVRAKAWEVKETMLQPSAEWPVYVCGEAYSSAQGWVEGALQTAERMLMDKFDLRSPDWLPMR
jgi:monoamine oxidase